MCPQIAVKDISICIQLCIHFLWQIESLKSQHGDLEKRVHSLKVASEPRKDKVDRLRELKKIIAAEEKEIERLTKGSKKLKER